MINVQHVRVKIFAERADSVDLGEAIPVFHRWIQQKTGDEMLIDVADYRHVPAGPGVVLVGHEAHYSLDGGGNRLGLLYNRRTPLEGSTLEKFRQAFGAALAACGRLEQEEPFRGKLKFNAGDCEVRINDRLLAPNTDATYNELKPEFERLFDSLYGPGGYVLDRIGEPRELFGVTAKTPQPVDVAGLLI